MNKKNKINNWVLSFIYSGILIIYVFAISEVLIRGDKLFSQSSGTLGIVLMLMLFVLSAAICGLLIFGRPFMLFIKGEKNKAFKFLGMNLLWIFILTLIFILILFLV